MLSIVTGTLNRLEILKLVIDNTINKSDKLELVLLDGGSVDGTIEYIKDLNHDRINLIELGERSSYPHFMNIGITESKFEWIAQWNDDVLLVNDWEDVFKLIKSNSHDAYIFDWTRGNLNDYSYGQIDMNPLSFGSTWIHFKDCMNFGIYKKSIFKEIGMYDNKFKYYECDHDMTTRCLFFNYKVSSAKNIKVFEILTEKRSIPYNEDRLIYIQNIRDYYNQKMIPPTAEKLIDKK